jgi:Fe-S cluster assembly protein SufD
MSTLTTNYLTPTGREEAWRFTPLKRLGGLHDGTFKLASRNTLAISGIAPSGVSFERLGRELVSAESKTDDVIVGRIHEAASEVTVLKIAANTELAEPLLLHRLAGGLTEAELSRVQLRIGANAKATVIIENSGDHLIVTRYAFI